MTYLQKDLYTPFFMDWSKNYEILDHFHKMYANGDIIGFSFNRYSGSDMPRPQLRIRCNVNDDNLDLLEQKIEELKSIGLISDHDDWKKFTASNEVRKATELSSKCAFAFDKWLTVNPKIMKTFLSKQNYKVQVYTRIDAMILNELGFDAHFERYPMSESDLKSIKSCAEECFKEIKDEFPDNVSITFFERFIHHFHNCIFMGMQTESVVYFQLIKWGWMGDLISRSRGK